jgi:serine phosphatase RsbU (regulator of sigma subunit)
MASIGLKQILGRQPEVRSLVSALADALGTSVTIEDAEGRLLHGDPALATGGARFPVTSGGASVGCVAGSNQARAVAALLDHLVAREVERKALGAEVLHLYREVNLIYSFSEKLAALLDVQRVARLTLQEARHMIAATDGLILLLNDESDLLEPVAAVGAEMSSLDGFRRNEGIVGAVAASGIGEIVNDVELDARRVTPHSAIRGLIAAPLKVGERVIGVIALGSTTAMAYTAAELKLLNTLALQAATAIENARLFERTIQTALERERLMALHQEAEVARAKLESELNFAAKIQADLFPAAMPSLPGYELAARNRPARRCGGDYYDALTVRSTGSAESRVLLCVADVAGKGLPAALVMSNMQAVLRTLLGRTDSVPALAAHASDLLFGSTAPEKYVTAALVELEPATGALRFVSAGHVNNLIVRANGEAVTLESTGTPLGLLPPGQSYDETLHTLGAGDLLVLFSDGVPEAQDEAGEEFGDERLIDVLRACRDVPPDELIGRVFDAIDRFAGEAPQFDDITMLVARRAG